MAGHAVLTLFDVDNTLIDNDHIVGELGELVLGRVPRLDGVYVATGGARKGILYSPAMGRAIADLVLDRQPRVALEAFAPDRFLR